jgi:hypothetical protein
MHGKQIHDGRARLCQRRLLRRQPACARKRARFGRHSWPFDGAEKRLFEALTKTSQTGAPNASKNGRFSNRLAFKKSFQINILTALTLRCTGPMFRVTPNDKSDSFFRPF